MATAKITLTNNMQLLGAGPLVITLEKGPLAGLHFASSLPADNAAVHRLRRGDRNSQAFNYTGSLNVYGRKYDSDNISNVELSYS